MRNKLPFSVLLSSLSLLSFTVDAVGPLSRSQISRLEQLNAQEQQRQQEQTKAQARRLQSARGVNFDTAVQQEISLPLKEANCYPISQIYLTDYSSTPSDVYASRFYWALNSAKNQLKLRLPHCFGAQSIQVLIKQIQNRIIEQGFVTTRVVVGEQNLHLGYLVLTIIPGTVRHTLVEDSSPYFRFTRLTAWTASAFKSGELLNVRDIEQTLENLKRVPTAEANIEILPSHDESGKVGESDIKIRYAQGFPLRLTLGLDDSGSQSTGKWQGNVSFSVDNLISANDLFYASFTHSIKRHTDEDGRRASRNLYFYYSIPFGYWNLSAQHSQNRYHQDIFAAFNNRYLYAGDSTTDKLILSYLLYRSAVKKLTISAGLWSRQSRNYIDHAEIEVQRRRMAGWDVGLALKHYFGGATLELNANYKRGTGGRGALPAPEELYDEGTSRLQIISANIRFSNPFQIGDQPWQFAMDWSAQWNLTPLILQDRFNIGGRYTVRGFDGELSLSGERGWTWRNELSWNVNGKGQSLYMAVDAGQVGGEATKTQLGRRLVGAALGIRGGLNGFYYDFFVSKPIKKPDGFRTLRDPLIISPKRNHV
ncbi:MAG: ShlB/FhaC/HecB family hemolysin secretion/activation protein [[Pasteurella] aerogenes]|nr:ShlB/FhaC/HecB family hemolysin secretion/activation protein [[Pasteurella] aerogenes]